MHGNTAVEIKSLSGTERSTVRISSEDQLESLNDNLFLRIYRLTAGFICRPVTKRPCRGCSRPSRQRRGG
ncbi:PD-(D/E)XK motif protein [Agrobacterium salinitolerans]|uniref:PD-(D/E)XK motif protein n=1 Tax=Agrobacterium salinitolerans TaxID=1183413 RepID=UPI0020B2C23C|nr:PD-(D/E)XK motif protein [Agrobacterium salinitolerans]